MAPTTNHRLDTRRAGRHPTRRLERRVDLLALTAGLVPGVGRIRAQVEPFAEAWAQANASALTGSGPLWVALGDSMTQGIGAASIDGGWVGQLRDRYRSGGIAVRVVNLSVTGARIGDVLRRQVSALRALGVEPDLVTVLAGANDMVGARRRRAAPPQMESLLAALPPGRTVVATLPRRNRAASAVNAAIDRAAARGDVHTADTRGKKLRSLLGSRADDHFHPNERGYRDLADTFDRAIGSSRLLVGNGVRADHVGPG
jgi:lysophospholipase L1-like esterase